MTSVNRSAPTRFSPCRVPTIWMSLRLGAMLTPAALLLLVARPAPAEGFDADLGVPVRPSDGQLANVELTGAGGVAGTLEHGLPTTFTFDAFDRDRDAPPQEKAPSRSDGVYGRFDGQVSFVPAVGMAWTQAGFMTEIGISGYYFHTVGIQAKYADGKLSPFSREAPFSIGTVSLALRPLFLYRWQRNLEQGPSWLDLTVDSLTLKVGGYWATEHDTDEQKRGLETELSFGVPLFLQVDGPYVGAAIAHRYPKVTHDDGSLDVALSLRFEWSFSLAQ
ncbi:MAG: hypothetical protein QM784_35540 [Polyangiaceae bacterium]